MSVQNVSERVYQGYNDSNDLFKLAEKQKWQEILNLVKDNPSLINEPIKEGPDTGKTLLWIAAYQLIHSESYEEPLKFILKLIHEIREPLILDAAPKMGPEEGENVLWMLAHKLTEYVEQEKNCPTKYYPTKYCPSYEILQVIRWLIVNHPFTMNAAPQTVNFKDVTVESLLSTVPNLINNPKFPQFKYY